MTDIKITVELKDIVDFQENKTELFEYDVKESLKVLLIRQGVSFKDFEIDFKYKKGSQPKNIILGEMHAAV